ncbi:fibrinogen-like protein 1 [Drosophila rhopaloa]|uniref:Fibrinogen-like protein 1 n=1 Tax=Drosophila rhopaloa TaxID=1041015 RepID=A0A6P4FH16_DRORH|nr:fibrinogen-like protein 1 [Drosophila rhopaloa]
MKSLFFVIFLTFLNLGELSSTDADLQQENSNDKKECNSYCFWVFKPVLDHFVQLKQESDTNNELKANINTMEKTIQDLQSRLAISESKVKSKDEQISDLKNHIESLKKTISEGSNQEEFLPETCPLTGSNGIYQIKPRGMESFKVPCVAPTPGWTVIQRRFDGSENFNRTWEDYKNGFGDIKGEFFIGLEKIHILTSMQPHALYIKLGKVDGTNKYAKYDDFIIGSEEESYELKMLGRYSGTAEDSLKYHEKSKFSTFDRDNDESDSNCAENHPGGWWFNKCAYSSLNGMYYKNGTRESNEKYGILWGSMHEYDYNISLTSVEILIRPRTI